MSVRVLVADDSSEVRRLVRAIIELHDRGWCVDAEAADGAAAVAVAADVRPDVVLLDLSMPVMDGLEALPRVREAAPDSVVVVLTGFGAESAERAAKDAGAHGFLEKQDLVASLVPRLEQILVALRAEAGESAEASPS